MTPCHVAAAMSSGMPHALGAAGSIPVSSILTAVASSARSMPASTSNSGAESPNRVAKMTIAIRPAATVGSSSVQSRMVPVRRAGARALRFPSI